MSQLKRDNRPDIGLEELDFKKPTKEVLEVLPAKQLSKKHIFLKDLKKDISFISVVSIALFAVLGNVSVYVWNKNPPSVTYIPKQISVSETALITNTAYKSAKSLLNFNYETINSSTNNDYFYKNNANDWQNNLKQLGIYDKIINNKGEITTDIQDVNLISKTIVHGMVRNNVSILFTQMYVDNNEKTVSKGRLILSIIENPDQPNQFLISHNHIILEEPTSTIIKEL